MKLIDTNLHLGLWPSRRLPLDRTPALVARLRRADVREAWAGSYDALMHRDIAAVNQRLVEQCQREGDGILVPWGTVNPRLPDWQDDVRRCAEEWGMKGVRLYPNYHGYSLADPLAAELLSQLDERRLVAQIVVRMEDPRTQPFMYRAPDVDWTPLLEHAAQFPSLRIIVLNGMNVFSPPDAARLARAGQVYFDIAMLEGVAGIERALADLSPDRLVFGSHAPFFTFDAALLKLRESELDDATLRAISYENASAILQRA